MNETSKRKRRAPWLALVLACLIGSLLLAANSHIGYAIALAVPGGMAATRLI